MPALLVALLLSAAPPGTASFTKDVAPILRQHCLACHAGPRAKGGLDLTARNNLLADNGHGSIVVPGRPDKSLLYSHVSEGKMPPKQPLPAATVEVLRRWIARGATWDGPALRPVAVVDGGTAGADWWSLQPVRRAAPPSVKNTALVRNPIDSFLLAKLEDRGLTFSPEADRRTLIRRVTFDLIGLPPTPEAVDAFVSDSAPDAYEKLVDRLLASPRHGERWARHWLDIVRFAESHGYEMNTLRPNAWPYRDYVIRAFNDDLDYPNFVRQQLAGDAGSGGEALASAGTGFLVAGAHDLVGNATEEGKRQQRADELADIVATTSATFLGLTVGCARCHDHKFDPIPQKDFYSMQAIFAGVQHAERPLALGDARARKRESERLRLRIVELERDEEEPLADPSARDKRSGVKPGRNVERVRPVKVRFVRMTILATTDGIEPCIDELELYAPGKKVNLALASAGVKPTASSVYPNSTIHRLEHLNDGKHGNGRSWISNERGKGWVKLEWPVEVEIERIVWGRDREGRYRDRLAKDYSIEGSSDGKQWTLLASSADRLPPGKGGRSSEVERLRAELAALERPASVYAGTFRTPDAVRLLKRGDVMQPLDLVGPGALSSVKPTLAISEKASEAERRLALAEWIARPDNPLTWRVLVNRLWHAHFGQGIVRTPSDFGYNGDRPSHPELLDWLAHESGQSGGLKRLHRLMVLSSAYRQSSRFSATNAAVDAGNRLLWRYSPRRLEAESIRDSLLFVAGSLETRMGGPGYHLWDYTGYVIVFEPKAKLGPDEFRRMIYQFKPRLQQDGTFGAFDCPDATTASPRRNVSTTALQALNLLNDPFVLDQSERFARRIESEAGSDPATQVERAFRLAFGRAPTETESTAAEKLLRKHGAAVLGRALFNAAEFVFVH